MWPFSGILHYERMYWRAVLQAPLATNHEVMSTGVLKFASPSLADDTVLIPSNNLTAAHLVAFVLHAALLFTLYFTRKYFSDFRRVSSFLWLSSMVAMPLSLWALIPHSINKDVFRPGLALTLSRKPIFSAILKVLKWGTYLVCQLGHFPAITVCMILSNFLSVVLIVTQFCAFVVAFPLISPLLWVCFSLFCPQKLLCQLCSPPQRYPNLFSLHSALYRPRPLQPALAWVRYSYKLCHPPRCPGLPTFLQASLNSGAHLQDLRSV